VTLKQTNSTISIDPKQSNLTRPFLPICLFLREHRSHAASIGRRRSWCVCVCQNLCAFVLVDAFDAHDMKNKERLRVCQYSHRLRHFSKHFRVKLDLGTFAPNVLL